MKPQVELLADGRVQVRTGKVELGQGLHTALAQIVADALGVPLAQVDMLPVDTDTSPDQGVTSGSLSLQQAGAALRDACSALRAAPAQRRAVGQSVTARDLSAKLAGEASFIHDLEMPDLLHGRVLHPPHLGDVLQACDDTQARAAEGVVAVVRSGSLLGVVAATSAQADAATALLASATTWVEADPSITAQPEEATDLLALPAVTRDVFQRRPPEGTAMPEPAKTLQAAYSKPWIAHASIAPSCALAQWDESGTDLRVWCHSQGIFNLRRDLALAFALDLTAVHVHHVPGAGCYGHNGADDVAFDTAWLAHEVPGRALRVMWSRADELTQSPQGPAMHVQLQASLDTEGHITSWQHDVWSPGHSRRPGRSPSPALLGAWQVEPAHEMPVSIDVPLAQGGGAERNAVPDYQFDAVQVRCHSVATRRRSSALRALGAFANVFAAESFMDEIASQTGHCPLALRQHHLQHDPRALAVLAAVTRSAGWSDREKSDPRDEGLGYGLGFARYKNNGAWCAVVAQVRVGATLQVLSLHIAVDVGLPVNPEGVVNQIEGGAIQATSWALKESAAPAHAGWADYPILTFTEVPAVTVTVMPSEEPSLGAGEAALGPTAAAIANALFDALGVRVRELPLTPERIVAAMDQAT